MDDGFIDLALAPQEKEGAISTATPERRDEPVYPFGTSISLENDQIEKLGLEDGEVGDYLHAEILVKLCGLHVTATEAGERKCMNLQITHLKILSDEDGDDDDDGDGDGRPASRDLYDDRE